jgi:hypothetical protein
VAEWHGCLWHVTLDSSFLVPHRHKALRVTQFLKKEEPLAVVSQGEQLICLLGTF